MARWKEAAALAAVTAALLKACGILLGDAKGNMNGQLAATRAEAFIMIAKLL